MMKEKLLLLKAIRKNNDGDKEQSNKDYLLIQDLLKIQQMSLLLQPAKRRKRFNQNMLQVMEARINQELQVN